MGKMGQKRGQVSFGFGFGLVWFGQVSPDSKEKGIVGKRT